MKIYAINGSPRKNWNCSELLAEFKKGVLSIIPDAEYHEIFLYDYTYKGCRSCFGCKLKTLEEPRCIIQDEIYDLLYNIRHADALVYASPIYFMNVSGELRCFFERLMYPGPTDKEIPTFAFYTMNAKKDKYETAIAPSIDIIHNYIRSNFKSPVQSHCAYFTYQRNNEELYKPSKHSNPEEKKAYRDLHWQDDLNAAYQSGVLLARQLLNK